MSILFYKLNSFNKPSLKHVFIASLPTELQADLQRQLAATNLSIADISLGKIFQTTMLCLDKICEQKEFFKELMADKKPFSEACKKPYLQIECKDEKKCFCPTKKKKHFKKHFHKKSSSKKPFRYFMKKYVSKYRKKKHNRCFICKKRGHFARNCPHKSAKVVRLIQHLQHSSLLSENEDVESNFLEQSEQNDQTAFILAESSDSDDISVISTVQNVNQVSTIPRPSLKMSILPSKFHKHVPVIGFIDTGADTNMIDPSVLPSDSWENHSKQFRAVNGETFETTLITKKHIGIQFFPNCIIWKKIVVSTLPDKDLLIDMLRLYTLSDVPTPYNHISQKFLEFCPENHSQFHHPSPLWKNEQFFIHLPFKLNEDINPTKASHPVDHPKTAFCIPDAHYQWTVMPFGLKVAPSLFQKAMTKIFSPILHHALVYIDDILLFSSDHDSHQKLLLDFFHIVQEHGIILSEKKSSIAKESIDFLGMVITNDHYQLGPHIATELLKFPNTHLNKKQIQQFLGIVNYVRDFIPKVVVHTSQLSRMLKKQCPLWGPAKTEAVKQLKVIAQSPPPLRIPTAGPRILQTDASDDYWSAILLERIDGLDHFCAHASGQFKDFEKNYHVIYKEILAVKYFFNVHSKTPDRLPTLCMENLFLTGLTLSHLSISEDELWPYFQHPETKDFWTQDMAYEWKTYPHPYPLIHDTSVTSVLRPYLMELNNVQPPATNIHHISVGPSHSLEIVPKTQTCTPCSSSSPHAILVMEQRPAYTNVLFQDAQDPWEDFQSLLPTENTPYIVTNPDSPASSTPKMTDADEEKYLQAEASLDQRQIRRAKHQYEKEIGDMSPSRYPSTP
ncbi:hypothetical protein KPL71_008211 [Citrus sinensis]|uniref:Uncharacterized protein n=1 Tax=Citrus sinensis TaxID=2711 RepID=A0ACB8M5F5_CITSI|nr:hypothetical protein KPL71_008211 [Citrus sinensis]